MITSLLKKILLWLCDASAEWLDPQRAKDRAELERGYAEYQRSAKSHIEERARDAALLVKLEEDLSLANGRVVNLTHQLHEQENAYQRLLQTQRDRLATVDALPDAAVLELPLTSAGQAGTGQTAGR